MNIVILNGTPRVKRYSRSQAYIDFVIGHYASHDINVFPVSRLVRELEKQTEQYRALLDAVSQADMVIWQVPVYSASVPAQMMRFINLICDDDNARLTFSGKYAASISTSINLFDNCVQEYLQAICEDLGMSYTGNFPGTILPIIDDTYHRKLIAFIDDLMFHQQNSIPVSRCFPDCSEPTPSIDWAAVQTAQAEEVSRSSEKTIAIIADCSDEKSNLGEMLSRFKAKSRAQVQVVNLADIDFDGCNSCLKCAANLTCAIKDDIQSLHENHIKGADAVVFAGEIRHRFLSDKIKAFIDRGFYNNHLPYMRGKPIGLIVSGRLSRNGLIKESLQSIMELRGGDLAGVVSDESADGGTVDKALTGLAERLVRTVESEAVRPLGFHGNAASRILRDFVFLVQYPFVAQLPYFRKHHFRTFPQKRFKVRLLGKVAMALSILKSQSKALADYNERAITSFRACFNLEPYDG